MLIQEIYFPAISQDIPATHCTCSPSLAPTVKCRNFSLNTNQY